MQLQGGGSIIKLVGIPNIHWCGTQGNYNIMIIDILGSSLEDLFNHCKRRFSVNTACLIGEQMLARIEYVHSKNFIHRDIKPDNFLTGAGKKKNIIYIIDFGLAKRYRDPKTGKHIDYIDGKSLTGTARYASINTHLGIGLMYNIEQSRRDDLESMAYVLIYFLIGELPWQGMKAKTTKEKYQKIMDKKISTSVDVLCSGIPDEFKLILNYTRDIKFDERPDYNRIKKYLTQMLDTESNRDEIKFDWVE